MAIQSLYLSQSFLRPYSVYTPGIMTIDMLSFVGSLPILRFLLRISKTLVGEFQQKESE